MFPEPKIGGLAFDPEESFTVWVSENIPAGKKSADGSTVLFVEDNTVYVAWISETEPPPHYFCHENPCKLLLPVIVSADKIKSVDFYKDRRDVIIFGSGTAIYAIEADQEGTQNFQPIYRGTDPSFYKSSEGALYIKDGVTLLKADL
jgi:hypothetical protein